MVRRLKKNPISLSYSLSCFSQNHSGKKTYSDQYGGLGGIICLRSDTHQNWLQTWHKAKLWETLEGCGASYIMPQRQQVAKLDAYTIWVFQVCAKILGITILGRCALICCWTVTKT